MKTTTTLHSLPVALAALLVACNDDGGPGSDYSFCAWGTDCADCGTRY